ncbi:MAG: hypothetical protein Q8L14_21875 [Myxococcales bacterium]|nr:hypothetical protein [Myxococcales bacterium]
MRIRSSAAASFVLALLLLQPGVAHASLFGEENGPLTALVAQGVLQLNQAAQTFEQLKQSYEEARKYAGMAQDAIEGFQEFGQLADSVFRNPENALRSAMPDAASLARDLQTPQAWGRGTGELQRLVRVCLGGGGECASFREAVTARQARDSISQTFGTSPVQRDDLETIDIEAGRAISGSMSVAAKSTLAGEQARALMEKCMGGTGNDAVAACQAAANVGQLMAVEQTASLNEQMAEGNRLKALELADKNADKKRALQQQLERQRILEAGVPEMAPPQMRVTAPAGDKR